MKIFLDDDPERDSWVDDTWTITRNLLECFSLLCENMGNVEVLSLDHDLGELEGTGYDLVMFLEIELGSGSMNPRVLPNRFEIHSANPVGRKNMQASIDAIERLRNIPWGNYR